MKKTQNLTILIILLIGSNLFSQETEFKKSAIKTGIGIAANDGHWETGIGIIYSIGYQKSFGKKDRFRINPNLLYGGFRPIGVTDTRDQYYRLTSLGFNLHYDLIKYKSLSIVTSAGLSGIYSRGLLGTGGFPDANNNESEYFNRFYVGANLSLGLRINPKNKRLAYEILPVNLQFGSNDFILGYIMFGIDFKLRK